MQQLRSANRRRPSPDASAELLDLGLAVSRLVRAQMRQQTPQGLTLPQVRALAFINADPECAPSQVAEYLMLGRPAVTRLLDGLVTRRLLTRAPHPDDRRRLRLSLTRAGRAVLDDYFTRARAIVAERLAVLGARERAAIRRALAPLLPLFAAPSDRDTGGR
jgi:DNA-binding MarR family transcriptional regulator